jgi:tetratricopeptide (TPR) repeat protein
VSDPKKPLGGDDLDDWASAIDEWDAALALPEGPPVPERKEPDRLVPNKPAARPATAGASSSVPEGTPLESPPPSPAAPAEDPLMHLFDGEMDLPEEAAGEALGSLLGEDPGQAPAAAEPAPGLLVAPGDELEVDAAFEDFGSESTRVAPAYEVSALLDNLDELEPAPRPAAPVDDTAFPSLDDEEAGFNQSESTRVASAEAINALLGELPEEMAPGPVEAPAPKLAAAESTDDVEIDTTPEAPAPTDDEFYDDIFIEANREESQRAAAPVKAVREPEPSEPILVDTPIATALPQTESQAITLVRGDVTSDPDRTPLPVAADEDALFEHSAPIAIPTEISRPVAATRLEAPVDFTAAAPPAPLSVPDSVPPQPLDAAYLRDQVALYDTERLLVDDPVRAAQLAYQAGRACEKLGDADAAIERYESALESDPASLMALRGLRRLRLAAGQTDRVLAMLDREKERASLAEKSALDALKAELELARGDRDLSRESFRELLERHPDDVAASLGLVDLADAEELPGALARATDALQASTDTRLKAQLLVERGRLDEAAGRARESVARYREALQLDPQAAGALWGLLRVAVRTPGESDDIDTHARLVELLPRSPLRGAVERRLGVLRLRAGDAAGARPVVQASAQGSLPLDATGPVGGGDPLALETLVELERAEGRLEEAANALSRIIEQETDAGRRADQLVLLGQLHEDRGSTAQAQAAYTRAASEYSDDPRAQRALERTQAAGGDKASQLERHLAAAERDPQRAPLEWTRAARLLEELGRHDEAIERLRAALERQPGFAPAVDLAVELELAAGRVDAAAAVMQAAAEVAEDSTFGASFRERAARLWARAGRRDEALAVVQPLLDDSDPLPTRWLVERLHGDAEPAALADSLQAEAELVEPSDPVRAAALWHRRGLLIQGSQPEAALESQRRTLTLDGNHGAAAVEVASQLLREGPGVELPTVWRERLQAAQGRAEAVALGLRLSSALVDDAGDAADAETVAREAAQRAPADLAVRDAVLRAARRAGNAGAVVEALERELELTTDAAARFALLCVLGERLEKRLQPDRAAERHRQALALKPQHPVAEAALERSLEAARNYAALADQALNDLKDAEDARKKVRAYERLAYIDGELRGDAESALLGFQSIIEVDPGNPRALRVLEGRYLRDGSFAELVMLYDQLAAGATDPSFAAAVHLDRARLRGMARPEGEPDAGFVAAVDNDNRLALTKDPHSRPALRHELGRARAKGDLQQIADVSARLAEAVGDDTRTAAVFLTRAAEALVDLERADDAKLRYQAALARSGLHLPALAGLLDLALVRGDWATAVEAAEQQGQTLKDTDGRASALLVAGILAEEKLSDQPRALANLRQALTVEPRSLEAFERLRRVLEQMKDWPALAELFQKRLEVETDGVRLVSLHLDLARLARDELNDRDRAQSELRAVLEQDAAHPEALRVLADLLYAGEQWTAAAEVLIKRARIEKTREGLKDIFFKLGIIYAEKQPDPKRAIASFTRVVKADPDDLVALEHLSNLFLKEWEWKGALQTTARLAELETDKTKRIAHLHRVAKIYEEGFKDARHALEAYRAALDIDPMNLGSIGDLARFFDRQSDVQSMRVHLDRASARVRSLVDHDAYDPTAYHSLVKIFIWRRSPDRAALAAGVLEYLGQVTEDERAILQKAVAKDPYPGSALADPALDETLFDVRVPAGFRHLFRLLDEPLSKLYRTDLKRLGLGKHEKLPPRGHAVRDIANRLASDLGIREFDLYLTPQHPTALMVELTEPLSIVIGSQLVEGAHEHEVRFHLGRAMKMMQAHLAVPMRLSADDLGVLVGAIVRQFVPDFVPAGFDEKLVAAEAARMSKLIPKKMQGELFPFAMECASPNLDLKQIAPALVETANRAGLLACGMMAPALSALKRLGDEGQVRALLRFAMGEEVAELRRQAGISLG